MSAYTQVKSNILLTLLRLSESESPVIRIRLRRSRCPKSWDSIPYLDGHPLTGSCWERKLEEVMVEEGWSEVLGWELLS